MRKKKGFELRDVCGEHVVMAYGMENIDFCKIISLNETAAFLWQGVGDGDFTAELIADLLCNEHDVDRVRALADSEAILAQWAKEGLLELPA